MKKSIVKTLQISTVIGCVIATSACDQMTKKERAAWGAAGGAVIGAVIGHQMDHDKGAVVGGIVGGVAGGSIGYYMDSAQEKLEKDLAKSGISVTRLDQSTIKLNIPSGLLFDVNKSNVSAGAVTSLGKISETLQKFEKTIIMVEGHADAQGADDYNLKLSQRRADAVGQQLTSRGVIPQRVLNRGHGETHPVADNDTVSGRAQNRRVELVMRAIEKGNEGAAFKSIY